MDYRISSRMQKDQPASGSEASNKEIQGNTPSVLCCFIDNKLLVVTSPDRLDVIGFMTG